jgi:cold shock CspA family protein/ribosome-associated translation inhibitor RaiA
VHVPVEVTWHGIEKSEAVEADIVEKANKLGEFYGQIIGCRVVVEPATRRHHHGNLFRVRIDVEVPDTHILATRDPALDHAHEDIYVAVRDAFDAARRQLQDYARIRRGHVRKPPVYQTATVLRTFPERDYGFLTTPDGREIYFDRYAVINADFDQFEAGTEVSFVEEEGEEGPRATQVSVGRHRRAT